MITEDELIDNKMLINDSYLSNNKFKHMQMLHVLNFDNEKTFSNLSSRELFDLKCRETSNFNQNIKFIKDIQENEKINKFDAFKIANERIMLSTRTGINTLTFEKNNLRVLQTYHFHAWKMIDMILQDKI